MKSPGRLLVFALVGLGVFLLAFGLGSMTRPDTSTDDHDDDHDETPVAAYRLEVEALDAGTDTLAFKVLDADGDPVTDYQVQHQKELHLIAVGADDLTDYQHLHPTRAEDGTWSVQIRTVPGTYRLYADTQPAGAEPQVIEADVDVPGTAREESQLPEPTTSVRVDGYTVTLDDSDEMLSFTVSRRDSLVALQPYLGAGGHLVAIRADDLSYLHVHPMDADQDTVSFHAEFDEPGRHVLHLDFKVDGKVRTATFSYDVPATDNDDGDDGEAHGDGH